MHYFPASWNSEILETIKFCATLKKGSVSLTKMSMLHWSHVCILGTEALLGMDLLCRESCHFVIVQKKIELAWVIINSFIYLYFIYLGMGKVLLYKLNSSLHVCSEQFVVICFVTN